MKIQNLTKIVFEVSFEFLELFMLQGVLEFLKVSMFFDLFKVTGILKTFKKSSRL